MADVVWQTNALNDLIKIVDYIEIFDSDAADRMAARLQALGNSLTDFPRRGRPAAGGCRELTSAPPYVIRYDVIGETVHILGIRHGRQRPPEQ